MSVFQSAVSHSIVIAVVMDFTVVIVSAHLSHGYTTAPGKRVKAVGLHLRRTGKALAFTVQGDTTLGLENHRAILIHFRVFHWMACTHTLRFSLFFFGFQWVHRWFKVSAARAPGETTGGGILEPVRSNKIIAEKETELGDKQKHLIKSAPQIRDVSKS